MSLVDGHWLPIDQCDPRAVALYLRHYSSAKGKRDPRSLREHGIVGPGEKLVLLTRDCASLFAWRAQRARQDGQIGVNCTIFRNESGVLSSLLIQEACQLAWAKWPGERLYTFVDPRKVRRKRDPGRCFVKAGWTRLAAPSKRRRLVILELLPEAVAT